MDLTQFLVVIPARKGSKGIPGKNRKLLNGKPLIQYSIDFALENFEHSQIYVSTDDEVILQIAEQNGIMVQELRPSHLATDQTSMQEVLKYIIAKQEAVGNHYGGIVLLQPTSPFRRPQDLVEMMNLFNDSIEMVVSVKESKLNPYFNLFEENEVGFLQKSKTSSTLNRQESPKVYAYNGSIYLLKINALKSTNISDFTKVKKFVMSTELSIDIDDSLDWGFAEYLIHHKRFDLD
jgi:CMP-N,N'-diacetyllegionaminic acid synthase